MNNSEWEWVEGYDNDGGYVDNLVFDVDEDTKLLSVITNQPLVSGERNSQFIRFQIPRYYDGVDLSTKNIQIIYMTESGFSDINTAVMVERSEDELRFGWLVPQGASYEVGILSFSLEFVGDDYIMKTRTTEVEVFDGLNGGEIIPEPTEKVWYIELQSRCDYVLNTAESARNDAQDSADHAKTSEDNAFTSKTNANVSEINAKASEQNAKKSEDEAKKYAAQAANVFTVAGNASFVVNGDKSVTMVFTKS